jgi:hypothetical protein
LKVFIRDGKPNEANLTDKEFIAEGGEGKIYGKGNVIYKIYSEPRKMIPLSKIDELQKLTQDNILNPKNVILDTNKQPIGFTMDWQKDTVALCKLFTNDFRNRFNIDNKVTSTLVERMVVDTSYIHKNGCLIVDGNEMNYLVDMKSFTVPYFIDVDSWQTPSFPATAIMASIRDHHSLKFNEMTDWFSFAVIATQLFMGIHPYKGTHPDYKKSDMEGRMKANVSIFNKDVRLPSAVRSVDEVPQAYKEWLMRVLEKGERIAPPNSAGTIIQSAPRIIPIIASNQFVLELIVDSLYPIKGFVNGWTYSTQFATKGRHSISLHDGMEIVESPISSVPVAAYVKDGMLHLESSVGNWFNMAAEEKMVIGNSIYIKNDDKLSVVELDEMGDKVFPSIKMTWSVLSNATKLFNGLVYQNILGVPYFMLFYRTASGKTACSQFQVKELQGYQVLEAKYENCVASVVAAKGGKFDTFMFKFAPDLSSYKLTLEEDTGLHVPNFVVMENGICVRITNEDEVHIFSNRIDRPDIKVVKDPAVTHDMKLTRSASTIMVRQGSKLYKFSMKK